MGAERKPIIALAVLCLGLGLASFNLVMISVAAGIWLVVHPLLVLMGKADPNLIAIYFRNQIYPRHIPAFTTPFRTMYGYKIAKEHKYWGR